MMYADYDYYKEFFFGTLIPDEYIFNYNALQATRYIDAVTFGRITDDNISDLVKNACCAASEVYYSSSASPQVVSGITSEKVDGYSVSYGAISSATTTKRRLNTAVKQWLGDSGLMFRGCE